MTTRIQLRRGTAAQWTSADPTLALGEAGIETDTLLWKVGDGVTIWSELPYMESGNGSFGNVTVTGNITTGNIKTNGYYFANGTPVPFGVTYGNSNVASFLAAYGSNTVNTTGNVTSGNFLTSGVVSATGNISGGNILTAGIVSATGNVSGNFFIGNGSQLTGIAASYGNANVVANLAALGSNPISTTGNITSGNISTGIITLTNGAVIRDTVGDAVAFGQNAGATGQGLVAVAIGNSAGNVNQGNISVAIGYQAGNTSQGDQSVAIGDSAGKTTQGESSVAVGQGAGQTTQGGSAIAIGFGAGAATQGTSAIAFGRLAGQTTQGIYGVAIGFEAGQTTQGNSAVAIGENAGYNTQGISAVAVGDGAGRDTQGQYAVAIGYGAGNSNQANNSIILNATGSVLEQTTVNTFTVKPVRQANTANAMYYDASTGEITYDTAGGGANTGNVTFSDVNIIGTGNLNLQPDSGSGEYLNIYLTAADDIHIAGTGNVILGTDEQANVAVLTSGNVAVQAGNVAGTQTWTFGTDGTLTTPSLNAPVDRLYYGLTFTYGSATIDFVLNANGTFSDIICANGGGGYSASSGSVIMPGTQLLNGASPANDITWDYVCAENDGVITSFTYASGTPPTYYNSIESGLDIGISANSNVWTFGQNGTLTIPGAVHSQVDNNLNFKIYNASNAGGSSFDVQNFQIDIDAVTTKFDVGASDITLITDFNNVGHTWNFDNTGNLTIPGNILGSGNILIAPDSASASSYLDIYLTGGPDIHIASNDSSIVIGRDTGANVFVGNDGEVSIRTDNGETPQIWNFTDTGNLTLPGNTFAVNYANGDPVTFSGGSANTGNVTFSDQAVIGTGDQEGGSGLYLAPGTESVGNLQYIRVRGGDVATHIHLDTGNNAYFDQYFGDDGKYVKLANTGNVEIGSDDAVGNSASWTFDTTGNLTLPGNTFAVNYANGTPVSISGGSANTGNVTFNDVNIIGTGNLKLQPNLANADAYLDIYLTSGPDIHIAGNGETVILGTDDFANVTVNVDGNVSIQASNGTPHTWTFDTAGNLTLPGNIIAINYANGNRVTGNVTFRDEIVIGTGTSNVISGLYLSPSSSSADANMYLRVRGNVNDEPTHIHFDTGNNQYYNQFIGDDNKYIQLANTGNIVINTNDMLGNTHQWSFDYLGTMYIPGNIKVTPNNDLDIKVYNANASGAVSFTVQNRQVDLAGAVTTQFDVTGNSIVLSTDVSDSNYQWTFDNAGNLAAPGVITATEFSTSGTGGDIVLTGGNIVSANVISANTVSSTGNVQITSSGNTWNFDTTGNLTFPTNNLVITPKVVAFSNAAVVSSANNLITLSTGVNGGVSSLWVQDYANIGTSNIAAVYANPTAGSGNVRIAVGTNGGSGPNLWDFDRNGNLSAPGNVSAVGNVIGAYIVGNGSELTNLPAPVVTQDITSNGVMSIMTYDGNIKYVNYATVEPSSGNIAGGNISASGNVTTAGWVVTTPMTLANLTAVAGARAFVNNGNLAAVGNFGAQIGSGGSNIVPVWSDGTNWYIG